MSTLGLLNDIALATLTAAKLVLRSAAAAGLDLDSSPEALASIEAMSDQTALQHLDQVAAMLLGNGRPESDLMRLRTSQLRWLWNAQESSADHVDDPEELPGRAAHVLGEIMLLLSRSRASIAGDSRREAHEDLAQILAMMALAKVLFSLLEGAASGPTITSLPKNEAVGPR